MARTIRSLAFLVLFVAIPSVAFSLAPHVPGEVIIKYRDNPTFAERANLRSHLKSNAKRKFTIIDAEVLKVDGMSVEQAVAAALEDPRVEYAEPNYVYQAHVVPNDPRFNEMYSLLNLGQTGGTPGADIRATQAWDVFTGDPEILVGVIDTGVDWTHPDLADNVWTNPGEIPANGIDDDDNGYIDDIHGYDFANGDGNPMDDHGHGTHVSGTIAARGDNGIGTVGVNWRARIVGIKFLSAGGSGSTEAAIASIEYAVKVGVRLTNNSWGGGAFSFALQDAIESAGEAGQLFVASAGNDFGNNNDTSPVYPVSYPIPAIVGVASTNHVDELSSFSNFGPTSVHIGAPGEDILSTFPGGNYGVLSGTSMAAPHVTGALALLMGYKPSIAAATAKAILLATADSIPGLAGRVVSGRLNAFLAIADPDTIPPGAIDDLVATLPTSNTITLEWHATGDDGETGRASRYDVRYSTSPITSGNIGAAPSAATGLPAPQPSGAPQSYEVKGLAHSTAYFFAIRALDEFGNTGPISNVPSATTLPPPQISATPESFHESLYTGQTAHRTLELRNVGAGTLDFEIPEPEPVGAPQAIHPFQALTKGAPDPRLGLEVSETRGGPDQFGYRWIDSDDPDGPVFAWEEISETGTPIADLVGDEGYVTGIPIGFDFPFYGNQFSTVNVGSNGWLSFTGGASPTYSHQPLPNAGVLVPENLLAVFWSDFNFRGEPRAIVAREPNRFILTFHDVPHYVFDGSYTFQVILHRSGEIRFQYYNMVGPTQYGTVGIQNGTKTDGLTVLFNANYMHGGLAVAIRPPARWLDVSPRSGRIAAGQSQTLDVDFDAAGLFGGTHRANLLVNSNDPAESTLALPVQLDVTGVPDIALSRTSYDFGNVFLGGTASDSLVIENAGTDSLHVTSIESSHPAYTVTQNAFTLGPFERVNLLVRFEPQALGAASGTLRVQSNDPDEAEVVVSLAGFAIEPPDISVTPESLSASLFTGETATRTLHVENTGTAELTVALSIESVPGSGASSGPPSSMTRRLPPGEVDPVGPPLSLPATLNSTGHTSPPRTTAGFYSGTFLDFGISDLGEVMPFSYRGQENLLVGGYISGYTVGYLEQGSAHVYTAAYGSVFGIAPVSYQEIVNTPALVIVEVVSRTVDDRLRITRRFTFRRQDKYVQVQTSVENTSGITLDGLVIKELADWDVDGDFQDDTWDDDPQFHMTWAGDEHYAAIASAETPDYVDIYGWPDFAGYETFVEFTDGPYADFDGLEMLHFNKGVIVAGGVARIGTAYIAADDLTELRQLAVIAVPSTGWLTTDPRVLTVPAGESRDVTVTFDATYLFGGDYEAQIVLMSNDPDESEVRVPAHLHVTGAPNLTVSPSSVDFGGTFVGYAAAETVRVSNAGTDDLVVSNVASNHLEFGVAPASFSLAPGLTQDVIVTFLPTSPGPRSAAMTIESNDPDEPSKSIDLSGEGLIPPVASVLPDSLEVTLLTGATANRTLRVSNTGGSGLDFAVGIAADTTAGPVAAKHHATAPVRTPGTNDGAAWALAVARVGGRPDAPGRPPEFDAALLPVVIDDPAGDSPYPDVIRLRAASTSGELRMHVELAMSFDPSDLGGAISLDIDQNPFTGAPPSFGLPSQDIGAEYDVWLFGSEFGLVDVLRRSDGVFVGSFPMTNEATGFSFAIPLALLDGDDGLIDVTGVVGTNSGPTDWFPDSGHGTVSSVSWLSVAPDSGRVGPGGFVDLDVAFDASGLFGGDYRAVVEIATNDPGPGGLLAVPVLLHVIGAPDLALDRVAIDFGSVFVGGSAGDTLVVTNVGTDQLTVTGIIATQSVFEVSETAFALDPGQSRVLFVTFAPSSATAFSGELRISSNDPDAPLAIVEVSGQGLIAPDIGVAPDSLSAALNPGQSTVREFTITNSGGSPLTFDIPQPQLSLPSPPHPVLVLAKGQADPRVGPPVAHGSGGPDGYGYRWKDSAEPDGPTFSWIDITPIGTPAPVYGDEDVAVGIPLGFSFPFYGGPDSSAHFLYVNVGSNGWLSFTDAPVPTYGVQPLPSYGAPANLIAPFWSDLDLQGAQRIYYHSDGQRFVVSWIDVPHYGSGGPYTFQAILHPNGVIHFQYLNMNYPLFASSIGIQNASRDIGLGVAFNFDYAYNGLAVRIDPPLQWLRAAPTAGTVEPGGSQVVQVTFDANGIPTGSYHSELFVRSNDPDLPVARIGARLDVNVIPEIAGAPRDFGTVYRGHSVVQPVLIWNQGGQPLQITGAHVVGAGFSLAAGVQGAVQLMPGDTTAIPVRFTYPPATGDSLGISFVAQCDGELIVISNDPDDDSLHVSLLATAIVAPQLEASPAAMRVALAPELGPIAATDTRMLTIRNGGGSELNVRVQAIEVAAGATARSKPIATAPEALHGKPALHGRAESSLSTAKPEGPVGLGSGGPDQFGYRWSDSDAPDGPVYEWLEIAIPSLRLPMTGNDRLTEAVPIGFDFPFYGNTFNTVNVCTNGWVSFTHLLSYAPTNYPLPNGAFEAPENLLAPFWDNLNFGSVQRAYAYHDSTIFVVTWQAVQAAAIGGGPYSFQIVLRPNGRIVFQYQSMNGTTQGATIGIQNAARDDGLTVAFDQSYVHDGLAVEFASGPEWLRPGVSALTIAAGSTAEIPVHFDAGGLAAGDHGAAIRVISNDVETPIVDIPVTAHVGAISTVFDLPNHLDRNSSAPWVEGRVTLPGGWDPHAITIRSVMVQNTVPVDLKAPTSYLGQSATFSFDHDLLLSQIPIGDAVPVTVTGRIGDQTWFHGVDVVQVLNATASTSAAPAPLEFALRHAGENPARGSAVLELAMPQRGAVEVAVYDVRGARVRDVARREMEPGWHRLSWDGNDSAGHPVGPGVYFVRAKQARRTLVTRIAMVR